jgi:hypothetical protein
MPTSFITIPVPSTSLPFNTPNIVSRTANDVLVVAIVNILYQSACYSRLLNKKITNQNYREPHNNTQDPFNDAIIRK